MDHQGFEGVVDQGEEIRVRVDATEWLVDRLHEGSGRARTQEACGAT